MRGIFVLAVLIVLVSSCLCYAEKGELGGKLDFSYVSSYLWRGFDAYAEGHSAIQPSIDLDLWGTGFGFKIWMSRAWSSGFENDEWLDYTLYYHNNFFVEEKYSTNYVVGWVYYNYPDDPREGSRSDPGSGDAQEVFASFSWPKLLPGGVVPSYTMVSYWPAVSNSNASDNAGWAHILGFRYGLEMPGILSDTSKQVFNLSMDIVYNDGVGPAGSTVDHDWSHAVFGVDTSFDLGHNLTFTPGVYYQSSWDDSVNDDDETWMKLSVSYKF